ncbi:MAG: RsmE family RNA methyltransferase, partial [Myxococcaceae bacterium]
PEAQQGEVSLSGPRLHYLARVLRLVVGDALEVFDGKGNAFEAQVRALNSESATLLLGAPRPEPKPRHIAIVQGLPKADKLELILQKGTELGASEFFPVEMIRSIAKRSDRSEKKTERWQRIAEEAARQCGRSDVPVVRPPMSLEEGISALRPGTVVLVLDEEEQATGLQTAAVSLTAGQPVAIVVGPEGGLDRSEVQWLLSRGARTVTLGRRVLRTETAAFVALTVLQVVDGELGV